MTILMMASRETRRVPRGWVHPRRERGYFLALYQHTTEEAQRTYYAENGWDWEEEHEDGFNAEDYMPAPTDDYQIMAFETVSEGTPLTGTAFDDSPDGRLALLRELVDGGHSIAGSTPDIESWAMILFSAAGGVLNIATGAFENLDHA